MSTQSVTIQGEIYEVPAPYVPGHVLTETEAAVLNQAFAAHIRNNIVAKMRQRAAKGEPPLTEQDVHDYAMAYTFEARKRRGPHVEPDDPVEKEARRLAKAAIVAALRRKGRTLKSVSPDKEARQAWLENMIDQMLSHDPSLRESAAQLVESRRNTLANVGNIEI